ncbi:MAG: hypothetical protein ACM3O6_13350 [Acidobacteriota bacterium]
MTEILPEEFAALCRRLDLVLTAEEAERLRAAYVAMQAQLRRIPRPETFFPEPATVYAHPGSKLTAAEKKR